MDQWIFQSFGSGSSGNCYYLGTTEQGILIDAGISARQIRKNLKVLGLDFNNIMGVLITHDHADHVKGVAALGERFHIPIYATKASHEGIRHNYAVKVSLDTSRRYIQKEESFQLANMDILPFSILHDSWDCVGYTITFQEKRFTLATDIGCSNAQLAHYISQSDFLVIEANYDEQLLLNGTYPKHLQMRIIADTGHFSNVACGKLIADNYHPRLKQICLCHLSKENNLPSLAHDTVWRYLEAKQIGKESVHVYPLERTEPGKLFRL